MLDDAKIQELKAKNKDLLHLDVGGVDLVFRKPKRLEFDQWFDKRDTGSAAGLSLAQQCLVYPERNEFMALLDDKPGVLMCRGGIVDAITDLAGADGGASAKKL